MSENAAEKEVEQYRGEDAPLFDSTGDVKGSIAYAIGIGKDSASHTIMEKVDDLCEFP